MIFCVLLHSKDTKCCELIDKYIERSDIYFICFLRINQYCFRLVRTLIQCHELQQYCLQLQGVWNEADVPYSKWVRREYYP